MSLPLNGLSIEELEHYSGIEPGASEELARRISQDRSAAERREDALRVMLEDAENSLSDTEYELDVAMDSLIDLRSAARKAVKSMRAMLPAVVDTPDKHKSAEEIIELLERLI